MRKERIHLFLFASALCVVVGGITKDAVAEGRHSGVWSQMIHDRQGRLVAASGNSRYGQTLQLTSDTEEEGDRVISRTTYARGNTVLEIERTYDGVLGLETIYQSGAERLVISLAWDDLTGETLVVYRFPDGEVFSLWLASDGEVLSGDLRGLRRALAMPMEVSRMLRAYVRDVEPFRQELPAAGDELAPVLRGCPDSCSLGCGGQCAFECHLGGAAVCRICRASCAIGCLIGCSS
jgi:hypothetical protein